MIAAAGAGFPAADRQPRRRDAAPADGEPRQRHWSREVYFVRSPDLSVETRRAIGRARRTWEEIHSRLWEQERRGRTEGIRAAARKGVLMGVGVRGLARAIDVHHTTLTRDLRHLTELGLIAVHRPDDETILEREGEGEPDGKKTGRIRKSSGRVASLTVEVTVGPEHLRPFGAQRDGGRGVLSARRAPLNRKGSLQEPLSDHRTPPRRPACGAGHRAADPAAAAAAPPPPSSRPKPPPVELRIDERNSGYGMVTMVCPGCRNSVCKPTMHWRESAGLTVPCSKCRSRVRVPAEPAIHDALQRAAERHAAWDRQNAEFAAHFERITTNLRQGKAGHAAGRAAGLTAGVREGEGTVAGQAVNVSPGTSSIVSPEPEPEPATPGQAPAVTPDASSRSTLTSDGGPADRPAAGTPGAAPVEPGPADDEERGLELLIDELRQRDAGYTVPAHYNRTIVTGWTGRVA